jgi:hypothetical protein
MFEEVNWKLVTKDPNAAQALKSDPLNRASLPDGLTARDLLPNVLVQSGTLKRGDLQTIPLASALGYSWFLRLEGKGEPDQGIEGFGATLNQQRRVQPRAFFPDQPETKVLSFDVEADAGEAIQVRALDSSGSPASAAAAVLWGDGTSDSPVDTTHTYGTAGRYTIQIVFQPDFSGVYTFVLEGKVDADTNQISVQINLPDLSGLSDAEEFKIRRFNNSDGGIFSTTNFALPLGPVSLLALDRNGLPERIPFGKLPEATELRGLRSNYEDDVNSYLSGNTVTEILNLNKADLKDTTAIDTIEDTLKELRTSGIPVDGRAISTNSDLTYIRCNAGDGQGTSAAKKISEFKDAPNLTVLRLSKKPGSVGKATLRSGFVRMDLLGMEQIDTLETDFTKAESTIESYKITYEETVSVAGSDPKLLPYVNPGENTGDASQCVDAAYSNRDNLGNMELVIGEDERISPYSSLNQDAINKIAGLGDPGNYNDDSLIDLGIWIAAGGFWFHKAVQEIGKILVSSANPDTLTLDLGQLSANTNGNYLGISNLDTLGKVADACFPAGNDVRINESGTVDGVYRITSGGSGNLDANNILTLTLDDGLHAIGDDGSLSGELWVQVGDNPNR